MLKNRLAQVGQGALQLPDFQRGWVWDDDRIKGFIASISKGFPIGAVMTLAANGQVAFSPRPIEGDTHLEFSLNIEATGSADG